MKEICKSKKDIVCDLWWNEIKAYCSEKGSTPHPSKSIHFNMNTIEN